ncbi:MAG TPA: hypothetical protein VLE27_05855 [Thermoanaerobaculia bacterium]|nr:hypothetical protein [Thermoanaerobaculia bacterium]
MLALILFLLAALLSVLGNGSGKPDAETPSVPAPSSPAALPSPVEPPPAAPAEPEPPVFVPEETPAAPVPEEPEAAGCPDGCEEPPPGCYIKGNTAQRGGERIYHVPGQQNYDDTVIEPWKGERWFCTEDEAVDNGWRKAKR